MIIMTILWGISISVYLISFEVTFYTVLMLLPFYNVSVNIKLTCSVKP